MIKPGLPWNDISGKPIESHFGGVLYDNGVYYWYGANWDGPTIPSDTFPNQPFTWFFNKGITIYRSTDLLRWEYVRSVLDEVIYKPSESRQPLNVLIRPKIIKNDRTGKFILIASLQSPDFHTFSDVVVATSDAPAGPYILQGKLGWKGTPNLSGLWNRTDDNFIHASKDSPTRIRGFDMTLFKDEDGKAYLILGRIDCVIYELSDDYLSVVRVAYMEGAEGEAPALFKTGGTYFLVTSRLTGWAPNQNTYFTSSSIWGPWTPRGPFASGPREETTFNSQVYFVLPVADRPNSFIFLGDDFHAASSRLIPDLRKATHVWLPIELNSQDHSMKVTWRDEWDLSVFPGR